jgi:predicted Zn-dependent protease
VGVLLGAGLLLVLVLFLITAVSSRRSAQAPAPAGPPAAPPAVEGGQPAVVPPQLAGQVEALEAEIEGLAGEAKVLKQRELVGLLAGGGLLARAVAAQEQIAEATGTAADWRRTGDLYYDIMSVQEGETKVEHARRAVEAYQRVLEQEPGNLDVRTDMATAYLNSNNPMQGVTEVKQVLEQDSTHIQARFNYGIMLAMIGRRDQAVEQFEVVKRLVGPGSPFYRQADEAIRSVQQGGSMR